MDTELLNQEKSLVAMCKFLLWLFTALIITFIGISNVFGATITDYGTKYYYYSVNDNSSTDVTSYRYGNDNFVTLFAPTAPTYDNSEGFNGFYNSIDYDIVQGNIYTLSMTLTFNGLQESEFSLSTLNERLLNLNFARGEEIEITAISGTYRRYNNTSPGLPSGLYDYAVRLVYTFVATSTTDRFWIGSYTGDDRTLCVNDHLYTVTAVISSLTIEENNSSTIINQNDTIINQNNQIIEENRQNTQDIIDNQNNNTQDIIDNQNQNFNIKKNCNNLFRFNKITDGNTYLGLTATKLSDGSYRFHGTTSGGFLNLSDIRYFSSSKTMSANSKTTSGSYYIYNQTNYTITYDNSNGFTYIRLYSGTYDFIVKLSISTNDYLKSYCEYGSQYDVNRLDETNDSINNLNDSLNDDDSSGATSEASDFFEDFTTNTFGLTSIITAPLNLIQSLTSSTCSELHLPLPYLNNKYLDLPCMTTIYQTHFGSFFTMYQTITYGIIAYWVIVRIFNQVKDFKNPEHDEIEVVDL